MQIGHRPGAIPAALAILSLFFGHGASSLSAASVKLSTPRVEISFDDASHYGIEYIVNDRGDSVAFDPQVPLWSITLFDTSAIGTAGTDDLYDIRCDNSDVDCGTPAHQFKNGYPGSSDTTLVIKWTDVTHDSFPDSDFDITAQVTIFGGAEDVSFGISVRNDSSFVSLFNVDYPFFRIDENTTRAEQILAIPYRSHGNLIEDPIKTFRAGVNDDLNQNATGNRQAGFGTDWGREATGHHPALISQQFLAYYDEGDSTGLYTATTDTMGFLKAFHVSGDTLARDLELFVRHFPGDNDSNFETTYTMPYWYRMRPFAGDWIDASKFYRDWLITSPMVRDAGGSLHFRKDFQSILDDAQYGMSYEPDDSTMEEQLDFFYDDDSDSLVVLGRFNPWGSWTRYPFILDYACNWRSATGDSVYPPDYVDAAQAMNGIVAPYTNPRKSPWRDYVYQSSTKYVCSYSGTFADDSLGTRAGSAIHNINGTQLTTNSSATDSSVEACPAEVLLQNKYVKGIGFILDDSLGLGGDGLYADTRGLPILCYDGDDHDHTNGGGDYYLQGRKRIFHFTDSLYADSDSLITVNEGPLDVKIGWRDYYLSEGSFESERGKDKLSERIVDDAILVPIVESVLHDQQGLMFGMVRHAYSDTADATTDPKGWYRMHHFELGMAHDFINGSMSVVNQDTLPMADWSNRQDDAYVYLRDMIKVRRDFAPYLVSGEWRRPPGLTSCDSVGVNFYGTVDSLPAVLTSGFIRVDSLGAAEDSLCLFFTNFSDDSATCITNYKLVDYGFSPGDTTLDFKFCEYLYDESSIDTTCIDTLTLSNSVTDTLNLGEGGIAILEHILLPRN